MKENVFIWIFWGAIILFSIVNSYFKAKKKREAAQAARDKARQPYEQGQREVIYAPEPEEQYAPKSLGQILEELANPQTQRTASTPKPIVSKPEFIEGHDYAVSRQEAVYKEGRSARFSYKEGRDAEAEAFYAEGGRTTKDSAGTEISGGKAAKARTQQTAEATGNASNSARDGNDGLVKDIFGDGFDIRRAIVEAEIITPKYF